MPYKDAQKNRERNRRWSRTAAGIASHMLRNAKYRAKELRVKFTITLRDIKIPKRCPVFGIPLKVGAMLASPNSPSLDRRNNAKGYVPGNVFVISWKANRRKADLTRKEILALARYVR